MKAQKIFSIVGATVLAIMGILVAGIGLENHSGLAVTFGILAMAVALVFIVVFNPSAVKNG